MEINASNFEVDGMIEIPVNFYEEIDGYGWSAKVNVWVKNNDSRAITRRESLEKSKMFIEKMLNAIDNEIKVVESLR
jgi:hypothetical protein